MDARVKPAHDAVIIAAMDFAVRLGKKLFPA
jgi:hypothetical protein